jgi:hypothetical protein
VEQKNNASLITKKMLAYMKEADDMALIGPVIKEQQKILNECMEKKISLVKLQNILIKQTGGGTQGGKTDFEKLALTSEDREILQKLIEENDDDVNNNTNNDDQIYKA